MSDNEPKFGELKEKPMSAVWPHEARSFTPWLANNIAALGKALDMNLRAKQTEAPVGRYSLDLLAEDLDTGKEVVIENQFYRTDHSHLGQLLTYAAGFDARAAVWVVEDATDEHREAVEWLNRKTDTETHFYLVAVKVLQICLPEDDSPPQAYQFLPIVAPNKVQKELHQRTATPLTAEEKARDAYYKPFTDEMREKFDHQASRNMNGAGGIRRGYLTGVRYWKYVHEMADNGYVYVYVLFSYENKATTDKLLESLLRRKSAINQKIDLDWDRNNWFHRAIGVWRKGSLSDSEETLAEIRAWAVDSMLKLAEAVPPEMLQEIADELEKEGGE